MDNPQTLATWATQDTGRRQATHITTDKGKKISNPDITRKR